MQLQRLMMNLSRVMAILGGIVLVLLIVLTCVSVLGRGLNTFGHSDLAQGLMPGFAEWLIATGVGPVLGDYELVEAGIAFSIFSFLPFCQITGGHASVDIFTARLPKRVNRLIQLVVELLFAITLIVIAWRLYEGMLSKMKYNETTFLLQFPIWWAYGVSFVASVLAALVGVYMVGVRAVEFLTARTIAPEMGAEH